MKLLFLTNNDNTRTLADWLSCIAKEEVIVLREKITKKLVQHHNPDFIISFNYKHIVGKDIINLLPNKIINLHIAWLPWNKGKDPNLWSFLEDTPKGVSIHFVDAGIDTGDIIAQKEIHFEDRLTATLGTTYQELHDSIVKLFQEMWPGIKDGSCLKTAQPAGGSFHKGVDKEKFMYLLTKGWDTPIVDIVGRGKNSEVTKS